ncbi:MAG: 23S rRNA (guanosine(2251)-2'-O)-methyltransferase RlmB [Bacillota bacterium]
MDRDHRLGDELILGRNPVSEALKAGARVKRVFVVRGLRGPRIESLVKEARSRGIPVEEIDRSRLDLIAGRHASVKHQGIVATAAPRSYSNVEGILAYAESRGEPPFVVALSGIEDPMNLGAILRTAEAAGLHGAIIPGRRAAGLTPAVTRASAGAVEHLRVAMVTNITSTLRELKRKGLWIAGLDAGGQCLWETDLRGPLAIVVGGEGKGLGRLVRETCDFIVGIPMKGRIESLNAGVAAALAIFEALRQRSDT